LQLPSYAPDPRFLPFETRTALTMCTTTESWHTIEDDKQKLFTKTWKVRFTIFLYTTQLVNGK
jgi:hypothetical protein